MWAKDSEQATTSTQAETQDGTIKTSSNDTATVAQLQMEIITLKKQLEEVHVFHMYLCVSDLPLIYFCYRQCVTLLRAREKQLHEYFGVHYLCVGVLQ